MLSTTPCRGTENPNQSPFRTRALTSHIFFFLKNPPPPEIYPLPPPAPLPTPKWVVPPASMRYIRTNFAEKERGLAIGIYMSGTKYGPAIGAPLAAYLVAGYGWQAMFVITG